MTQVQFGFTLPADQLDKARQRTYVDDLNRALTLVHGHFDSAWFIDHLQFGNMAVLEGFTALSYIAALHPPLKFGHTVLCQSFRNPALLAKMGATLQFLSGGRLILGQGAGWHEEEYDTPLLPFRRAAGGCGGDPATAVGGWFCLADLPGLGCTGVRSN